MSRLSMTSVVWAFFCMVAPATAQSQHGKLPDGPGKETVEAVCTACHQTNQITNSSGYTRAQWEELFGNMIDLSGNPEKETIAAYLAEHFPPNTRRRAEAHTGSRRRSPSRNGRCRRWASARAIRSRRRTARSGGPGSSATWLGGSTPEPAR